MSSRMQVRTHNYEMGPHVNYTWAASFNLGQPTSHDEVITQVGEVAKKLHSPAYGISGAMRGGPLLTTSIRLNLDPSRTYGTATLPQCEEVATLLGDLDGWERTQPRRVAHQIIMGRRHRGEATAGIRSFEQALDVGRVCLSGHQTSFEQAELFSVRHIPGEGLRTYHEPAVIIDGSVDMLEGALCMGQELGQARVVSEVHDTVTQVYQQRP